MAPRLPLLIAAFFLIQCHGKDQIGSADARGLAKANGADAGVRTDPLASCADDEKCTSDLGYEDEDTVAASPTSVSGAYLTCQKAADSAFLACQVEREKTLIRVPSSARLEWSMLFGGAPAVTTAKVHDALSAGTYFYVSLPSAEVSTVSLNVQEGAASDTLSFALSSLPSEDATLALTAMPADAIPASDSTSSFDLDQPLGNGVVSDENDSCLNNADVSGASKSVTKDINYADEAGKVSFYADDVCGLQSNSAYMTITPEAPIKPIFVKLVPNARKLLLFRNQDFVPGPVSFNFGYLGSNTLDDFRLGSFTFVH